MTIYLACKAQIALLIAEKITILAKYADFANVFLKKLAKVLLERTSINKYAIKLVDSKQSLYGPIYSLGQVEHKTLITYIKTNLANGFIQSFKSPAGAPIIFIRKPDGSLHLYIDYQGLNNFTIKNWHLLQLIGKSLDWLK